MKSIKKISILLVVLFAGIQLIPRNYNQSKEALKTDFIKLFNAPKPIENILKTSCYDCHSNNTNYPWYSTIQPAAWFMESHIKEGKEELNFSEFGNYSKRRQKGKLKSIISQVKDDEMPLWSYTLIHKDAILSNKDKEAIVNWFTNVRENLTTQK